MMMEEEDLALARSLTKVTKQSQVRLHFWMDGLRRIDRDGVEGDVVECGVYLGSSIVAARKVSPQRTCWLYDTFEGMTRPGPMDTTRRGFSASISYEARMAQGIGWAAASVDQVKDTLKAHGVYDDSKLSFVVGPVEETLMKEKNLPKKIAALRLDTDWYASTKVELEVLYPRLAKGGLLIIDDYGHWLGARKAVDEYFPDGVFEGVDYSAIRMFKW